MVKHKIFVSGEKHYKDEAFLREKLNQIKSSYAKETDFALIRLETLKGTDGIVRMWAIENNIITISMPILWKRFGYDAKIIANRLVITELKPDYLITFGNDSNLAACTLCARNNNIQVYCF